MLNYNDLISQQFIMTPCGLGNYSKPLPLLDSEDEDAKVQSLIRLRACVQKLVSIKFLRNGLNLYLPGILAREEIDEIEKMLIQVATIERNLTVYLYLAQTKLEKEKRQI